MKTIQKIVVSVAPGIENKMPFYGLCKKKREISTSVFLDYPRYFFKTYQIALYRPGSNQTKCTTVSSITLKLLLWKPVYSYSENSEAFKS